MNFTGALVRAVVRAVDWRPLAAAAVFTVVTAFATDPGPTSDTRTFAVTLRITALLLGAAAGFALVDEMTEIAIPAPLPGWVVQWTRVLAALGWAAAAWALGLTVMARGFPVGLALGIPGLMTEAAFLVLSCLALTAVAVRRRREPAAATAAAAVMFVLAVLSLPYRDIVWPTPGDPTWSGVHAVWSAALVVPVAILALANRETR